MPYGQPAHGGSARPTSRSFHRLCRASGITREINDQSSSEWPQQVDVLEPLVRAKWSSALYTLTRRDANFSRTPVAQQADPRSHSQVNRDGAEPAPVKPSPRMIAVRSGVTSASSRVTSQRVSAP